jgi:predicted  nucleic acid-binding Zn-ribbon protein
MTKRQKQIEALREEISRRERGLIRLRREMVEATDAHDQQAQRLQDSLEQLRALTNEPTVVEQLMMRTK